MTDRKLKTIFLVSGIFPGKADSAILLGFECTINPQNLIKIVSAIFEKFEILNFFLMWTTLNFRGREKTKKKSSRYLQEDPRYRIWTWLFSWSRRYVRQSSHRKKYVWVSGIFPGKADSVNIIGLECSLLQIHKVCLKSLELFLRKSKFLIFLIWTILNFRDMGSKLDSFLRKRCFLFSFVHVVLLMSLEIMQKIYISRFMLQGRNIIFKNIYMFDVVYVKSNSIWC